MQIYVAWEDAGGGDTGPIFMIRGAYTSREQAAAAYPACCIVEVELQAEAKRYVTYWTPTTINTCRACPNFKDHGSYRICGLNIGIRNAPYDIKDPDEIPGWCPHEGRR